MERTALMFCNGGFQCKNWTGSRGTSPNSNGKRLLELVRVGNLRTGYQLQCCDGRWTWGSGARKSVIDYMLFSCSPVMVGGLGEVV